MKMEAEVKWSGSNFHSKPYVTAWTDFDSLTQFAALISCFGDPKDTPH